MKNRRMFWSIVEKIEARIDSGEFAPGSRLPPEREFVECYNVSRPTIREAIIALEVRGRVEVKTGSGVYVLDKAKETSTDTKISAFELTQARALFEGEAAALAALSITDEQLSALDKTMEQMEIGKDVEQADQEFHLIIAKATKNTAILNAILGLWNVRTTKTEVVEAYKEICSQSNQKRLEEHREILNALKERDTNAARTAMHKHFQRLINALFDASEAKALEQIKKKTTQTRGLYSLDHVVVGRAN
ncbi:FadR family transcriptional regulator [Catenovulum sp. 2E275]|uniref:FadR/GntR family transcriptional regulator n=1 Tax=Catenovulum sp. 2E275 TaxID=2980497 RepID=UPI0021D2527C|nr:FadR/GntR family transcriptional regulator [Catenovulum sp. 2E275]MCU4674023.1 FadR family transcriptional regulator [Catenovulum sp. 2E275]